MRVPEELMRALRAIPEQKEELIRYWDLNDAYDVKINMIEGGLSLPEHTHPVTVYNLVLDGEFVVGIGGERRRVAKGEWIRIPAGVLHSAETVVATTLLELWEKVGR